MLREDNTISEVREWLEKEADYHSNYFIIINNKNEFKGIISSSNLFSNHHLPQKKVGELIKRNSVSVNNDGNLRAAVELMARENIDMLPVVSNENNIIGILSYKDIIAAYKKDIDNNTKKSPSISLKRNRMKMLVRGQRLINIFKKN